MMYNWRHLEIKGVARGDSIDAALQKRTVPSCGEPFQAWEMWLSPPLGKPVGSEVGGQDPRPWISSPVGNQACIVLKTAMRLALAKTPSP